MIWVKNTIGTIKDGNSIYGNFKTARFGWSNDNCCIGKGADKTPIVTTVSKNKIPTIFQIINSPFDGLYLEN